MGCGACCADALLIASLPLLDLVVFTHPAPHHSKLALPLPERVDEGKGEAKWTAATHTLSLHLPILRDFTL